MGKPRTGGLGASARRGPTPRSPRPRWCASSRAPLRGRYWPG